MTNYTPAIEAIIRAEKADADAQLVMPGYTRGDLSAAFKLVQNKEHWKLEIDQHGIPADKLEAVIFAIEFFTGSLATAEYDGLTEAGGATFRVKAAGYYQTIGA
jgi:hypothetical protein